MDDPDPCRDLHRPRDQRLPTGRILIRNPVLRDLRKKDARHRARWRGRRQFWDRQVRKKAVPSRLMPSVRFCLTLLLTPDLRAQMQAAALRCETRRQGRRTLRPASRCAAPPPAADAWLRKPRVVGHNRVDDDLAVMPPAQFLDVAAARLIASANVARNHVRCRGAAASLVNWRR